ncbi:AtpZ/AtpI family protein [Helicobacter macacae]|uniref:ATP synthase protein I n=1 Tax=Helicobacter macacae MIT 99-5501 TaxID=1357400 RepID=V8CBV4_9HELI|nr:AtpZ/AtpI family protein [Helicobacter macacae]ETD24898.1 hypothetical protein HMPREF2086_00232 [Helicobacter macacae MIT 99-5501]
MQEKQEKSTQAKESLDLADSASKTDTAKSLESTKPSKSAESADFEGLIDFKDTPDSARYSKVQKVISGAYDLSLGISIVVAILLGLGIGYVLQRISGSVWLLWLGIFWGVAAAGLNIHKAYKRTKAELDALADDPRYSYKKHSTNDEDD